MTIGFQARQSENSAPQHLHLGFPGIARVQLYNEDFEPTLKAKNPSYNIPE